MERTDSEGKAAGRKAYHGRLAMHNPTFSGFFLHRSRQIDGGTRAMLKRCVGRIDVFAEALFGFCCGETAVAVKVGRILCLTREKR